MPRSSRDVLRDLDENRAQSVALGRTRRRLEEELMEARLAEVGANPHPWLGKKLKREVPASAYGRNRHHTKTIRGTLKVKQEREYYRHSTAGVGELIVVTDSGITAYNFVTRADETEWELA